MTAMFVVGCLASIAFGFYMFGMTLYVLQSQEELEAMGMPLMAFTPKWIFIFIPLVFLGYTKRVKLVFDWLGSQMLGV